MYDDTPYAADVGIDVSTQLVMVLLAPKGTPSDRVRFCMTFKKTLEDPEF